MSRMKGGEKGMFDRRSVFMHGFEPIDDIKDILNLKKSGFLTEPLSKIYNEAVLRCMLTTDKAIESQLFWTRYQDHFSIDAFCVVLTIYVSIPKEMFEDIYFDDFRAFHESVTQRTLSSEKIEFSPQYSDIETKVDFKRSRLANFLKLVYEKNNNQRVNTKDEAFEKFLLLFHMHSLNSFRMPDEYVDTFFGKKMVGFKLPYLLLILGLAIGINNSILERYFDKKTITRLSTTPVNPQQSPGPTGDLSEDGE